MSEFDHLFEDDKPASEPKKDTEESTPTEDVEIPTQTSNPYLTKKNLAIASGAILSIVLGSMLFSNLHCGGVTITVDEAYNKALQACKSKAEDKSQCESIVQKMRENEAIEINGSEVKITGGDPIDCTTTGCEDIEDALTTYVCDKTTCVIPKDIFIFTLGSEEIAGAPGGGGTIEDVRIQTLMYPPAVVPKGLKLEGMKDAYEEEFSVCEAPKGLANGTKVDGAIGCCSKECSDKGDASEFENCIVSAYSDHWIYCGTIREDAYTRPGESWSRLRPEEVAVSFMYYRAAAAAETNADIPLNRVWIDQAKSASIRAFNWSIFEEVLVDSSWQDYVNNFPSYIEKKNYKTIKNALSKAFESNADRKVCFVLNAADVEGGQLEKFDNPAISMALAMPVFATYDNTEDPEILRATPFLNYMQTMTEDPSLWSKLFFKSDEKSISNRNRNVAMNAFKNPNTNEKLREPSSSIGDEVDLLKASQSSTSLEFEDTSTRKRYDIKFKENQESYNGYNIHYETLLEDKQLDAKLKECKDNKKCCLFDVAYSKSGGLRPEISTVDPSVISLYGADNQKSCVGPIFHNIINNENMRRKINEQIDSSLDRPNTGLSVCEECRLGGLLPKYITDSAPPPRNKFPSGTPSCRNSEVIIGFPASKQQTLESIAETIKNELNKNYSGTFNATVKSLQSSDIQTGGFTILLDEEIFYTMKKAPSLYKYKLKDPKKGRTTTPFTEFTDNNLDSRCTQCLFQTADSFLYGGTPAYATNNEKNCDSEGEFLINECGIDDVHLKDYNSLLPKLEEYYQRNSENPILHLYYFAPQRIITEGNVVGGENCQEALEDIIKKR